MLPKPGDLLTFRHDLIIGNDYGGFECEREDIEFASENPIVTLSTITHEDTQITVEEHDDRWFTLEMFEKPVPKNLSKEKLDTLFDMMLNEKITEEQYKAEIDKRVKKINPRATLVE
jgi:hypothetical protein